MKLKTSLLIGILTLTAACKDGPRDNLYSPGNMEEPRRISSPWDKNVIYNYPEGSNERRFVDYAPLGSLDEVITIRNGERVSLRKGDPGFKVQEEVYLSKIKPLYEK